MHRRVAACASPLHCNHPVRTAVPQAACMRGQEAFGGHARAAACRPRALTVGLHAMHRFTYVNQVVGAHDGHCGRRQADCCRFQLLNKL